MRTTIFRRLGAALLAAAVCVTSVPAGTAQANDAPVNVSHVTVHDPSILKADGTYYVFGSHLADAKSTNLMDWTQMNPDWNWRGGDSWKNDSVYGEVLTNLAEPFAWAGYDDGDVKNGSLGVWAPDVKYNPDYAWEDGSKGAYMLYYSTTSTWRRSCIGYAVSKTPEGPYQHIDTIVYSGFTKTGEVDNGANNGVSTRNTKWDNEYLNLKELIDADVIAEVSDKWFTSGGGWNENYAPNAIDPTVFFGKDDKMYLCYGSWSGGIFILELDKATGAVKYPGEDGTESVSGNFIDRYFGTHIAGGNHQSGEGPYILYDEESGYYYLYETYGNLSASGGYNMRLFRSENVYGPYTDAMGRNAKDNGRDNDKYGIKLIGNYQFENQAGYRAAGHNSVFIDDDGQRYLIHHQRFDQRRWPDHEVRVRQQFLNEDGWPVPAVYEYRGEKIEHYSDEAIVGTYDIINHGTTTSGDMISSTKITLSADGTVSGSMNGNWKKSTGEGKEYDYITLELDGAVYKGFLHKQFNEYNSPQKVMTFSVIGDNNTCLWGSHEAPLKSLSEALVYGFNFEAAVSNGSVSPVKSSSKNDMAKLSGTASVVTDATRGKVLQVKSTENSFNANYLHLPSDAFSTVTADGFTIAMWVNIGNDTKGTSALFEANTGSREITYPMTRINADLSASIYANANAGSDANAIPRDEWHHIAYSVDAKGIKLYVDGKGVCELQEDLSQCFDASSEECIQKVENVRVGSGLIMGTEDVRDVKYDDIAVYSAALSAEQVKEIYSTDTLKDKEEETPPPVKSEQVISVNSVYNKTYGNQAFSLNARLTKGNGSLSYVSSAPKVASVDARTGKVSIKDTGIATITITAAETSNYKKQTKTVTIKVAPKKTFLSTVKSKSKKKAVLTWKKASRASGYRIQYATNKKFKSARTVFVKNAAAKTKTITKLKSKKTYYFRIQPYKKSGKAFIYGTYSKAKLVKIK